MLRHLWGVECRHINLTVWWSLGTCDKPALSLCHLQCSLGIFQPLREDLAIVPSDREETGGLSAWEGIIAGRERQVTYLG